AFSLLHIHVILFPLFFFFLPDTAPSEIYTLSLHDALPISRMTATRSSRPRRAGGRASGGRASARSSAASASSASWCAAARAARRSEEHTSELQSLTNIVCRLLLEKKKTNSPHVLPHELTYT